MEMHQLRYVVAVARTGNFSRAAKQCHIAQPSLSQQVQKLEDELGERLFDRMKRVAKLTSHGKAFLRHAERILEEVDAAQREVSDARNLLRGTITVGVLPTIAPYLLPGVIAEFTGKFPTLEVVIQEDTTAQLLNMAHAFELDFALTSLPIHDDRFEINELFTEELWLAVPSDHRLARKRTLNPSDLDGDRLIVMKEGHCLGDQVLNFCERRNLHPSISFRSAQLETIKALVHAGAGIALLPAMAVKAASGDRLKFRRFSTPRPTRKIATLWPKQRPPGRAASEFIGMLRRLSKAPLR